MDYCIGIDHYFSQSDDGVGYSVNKLKPRQIFVLRLLNGIRSDNLFRLLPKKILIKK